MGATAASEKTSDGLSWYAIRTKPREEERASKNLVAWNVETLSPKIRECRRNQFTDKPTYLVKPLFPTYIFARFHPDNLRKIRFTRGVHNVVGFGGQLTPVDDAAIELIQSRIARDGFARIGDDDDFRAGDRVLIKDGVLRDLLGVFERHLEDEERVSILLNTLSYQARVTVEKNCVRKVREGRSQ